MEKSAANDIRSRLPPAASVRGREALCAAVVALMGEAQRAVRLYAAQLDPAVFDSSAVADALAAFARDPRNRAAMLLENAAVLEHNQRLLAVARRLAGTVQLRQADEQDRGARALYLLVDRAAHLQQEDVTRTEAVIARQTARETTRLVEQFDAAWERGTGIALRTLGL
jgi:hypothetical protein